MRNPWILIGLGLVVLPAMATTTLFAREIEPVVEPDAAAESPIETKVFGYSTLGKPITGYVIGDGDERVFFFGGIHGTEKGTVALLDRLIVELQGNPNLVPDDTSLIVIPVVNPDGYLDRGDKLNANGVNLNLNFGTEVWISNVEEMYAGPAPFSEVESRLIKEIVEVYQPSMMISYHSMGGLTVPEFSEGSIELAHWYAEKTGYAFFDEWDYPGNATRWFEEVTGNPSITVELTNHTESDWEINKQAIFELLAR